MTDPLTFDLVYDLAQPQLSCEICPILNDYNDITQRSFTAKVSVANNLICIYRARLAREISGDDPRNWFDILLSFSSNFFYPLFYFSTA